jgi:ankyrin repeat protein
VAQGNVKIVKLLIEYKAEVNIKNYVVNYIQFGRTSLHYAASYGFGEIA